MVKITDEMKEVFIGSHGWALATASKEGVPNVVTVGCGKILSDNEILIADNFMGKTVENIKANPEVALAVWDWHNVWGYQFKGTARIEYSGKMFDEAVAVDMARAKWRRRSLEPEVFAKLLVRIPELKPKAAIIITVKSIYMLSPGHGYAGKLLSS